MGTMILQKTSILTPSISTKWAKAKCVERSGIRKLRQISPIGIIDSSAEMRMLYSQIIRNLNHPYRLSKRKRSARRYLLLVNKVRFLHSKSKIFRSKWELWFYKKTRILISPISTKWAKAKCVEISVSIL